MLENLEQIPLAQTDDHEQGRERTAAKLVIEPARGVPDAVRGSHSAIRATKAGARRADRVDGAASGLRRAKAASVAATLGSYSGIAAWSSTSAPAASWRWSKVLSLDTLRRIAAASKGDWRATQMAG